MTNPATTPAWSAIAAYIRSQPPLQELFAQDAARTSRFTYQLDKDFILDLSKQPLTESVLTLLQAFARQQNVEGKIAALFSGEVMNQTEGRAVQHMALRRPAQLPAFVGGSDVMPEVEAVRARMASFANSVRSGQWLGATGQRITHVVHIGIGGPLLGPELAVRALRPYHNGPAVRSVTNIDPADLAAALAGLSPATTLFIIASKTFTTQETLANAKAARAWLVAALGEAAVANHFVAASTNAAGVAAFGISPANMFPYWGWVGGRFSLWSAAGLCIMLAIGPENFTALLSGAYELDDHFAKSPLDQNLPVLLALVGILNRNFFNRASRAVLPYAQDLALLPPYLQQLEMESNGKRVHQDGTPVVIGTSPVVFGQPGSNGQHAFHQQLHQGPDVIPADFILFKAAHPADEAVAPGQHRLLTLNGLAQSAALLRGRPAEETPDGHRAFPGNRPSTTLLLNALTPRSLGRLLALYEHKVAVEGWLWNINSFDQFGVELGKQIALELAEKGAGQLDSSTQALLRSI